LTTLGDIPSVVWRTSLPPHRPQTTLLTLGTLPQSGNTLLRSRAISLTFKTSLSGHLVRGDERLVGASPHRVRGAHPRIEEPPGMYAAVTGITVLSCFVALYHVLAGKAPGLEGAVQDGGEWGGFTLMAVWSEARVCSFSHHHANSHLPPAVQALGVHCPHRVPTPRHRPRHRLGHVLGAPAQ